MPVRPYENVTFITRLSRAEVLARLNAQVETDLEAYATTDKAFMGKFTGDEFEIYRRLTTRNDFQPVLSGVIEEASDGTAVNVAMRLAPRVMWFMMLWMAVTAGVGCYIAWTTNSTDQLGPFGMTAFGYGLTTIGFTAESRKAKRLLRMYLDAEAI
jgi:hypothetical protein